MERVKNCPLVLWYGMVFKPEKLVCDVVLCNIALLPSKNMVRSELRQWFLILREYLVSRVVKTNAQKSKWTCCYAVVQDTNKVVSNRRRSKFTCRERENFKVTRRKRDNFLAVGKPGNQLLLVKHSLLFIGVLYFAKYRLLQTAKKSGNRNIGMFFVYFQFTSALTVKIIKS